MIKQSVRFISFILSTFIILLVFNYISDSQRMPFDTTNQFRLSIGESSISKENIIKNLNEMTDKNKGILVKVAVDIENHKNKKDIIWFGSKEPKAQDIVIEDQKISWLDPSLTGQMIRSSDMGVRPLHGTYAIKGTQMFQDGLNTWAKNNGLDIEFIKQVQTYKLPFQYLFNTGLGNAVFTALLLLLMTFIAWFVVHAKARALRMLGGVPMKRLHKEDVSEVSKQIAIGFIIGSFIILGYIGLTAGFKQVLLISLQVFLTLFFTLLLLCVLLLSISIVVRPRAKHIAKREIPLKRFNQLGTFVRIGAIFLALLIVPTTIMSASLSYEMSKEYDLWKSMNKNVRVSLNDIEPLETTKMLPSTEAFLKDMQNNNNLRLSIVINKVMDFDKEELGGYDHIIITDKAWVKAFGVEINSQGTGGTLAAIEFDKLQPMLKKNLSELIPLWTKTKEIKPKGLGFYEYKGKQFIASPGESNTVHARKPLVILLDDVTEVLKTDFLLSALSTGNLVFANEDQLRIALAKYPIKDFITSIDSIADSALTLAQQFSKEAFYYVTACIMILTAIVFAGIMSAQLWVDANKKQIFTLHTYGRTYASIIKPVLNKEFIIMGGTILVSSILVFYLRYPTFPILVIVALAIGILYGVGNLCAYLICAKRKFHKTIHRYY